MQGMMMDRPLMIADILNFAVQNHPDAEIVSAGMPGAIERIAYRDVAGRIAALAHGLIGLGVGPGDRVATLAWNSHRHFELYYAISGIGAVCHTINPRLPVEQIAYIVGDADDRLLFADSAFAALIEALAPRFPDLMVGFLAERADMPAAPERALCYAELLEGQPTAFDWPTFPELTAAGLCYTSGTTGAPKGALYTHRSTVLHAFGLALGMAHSLRERGRVLPAVPLFHASAWGLPFAAPLTGASLIMPGADLDGPSLFALMERERVHSGWGVPTVWLGLLAEIRERGRLPDGFGDVMIGGSAASPAMVEEFERLGVNVCHAWGMTEMNPVGTLANLPPAFDGEPLHVAVQQKAKQGRPLFGVDLKVVDDDGATLPRDGTTVGALKARGNTVISGYYKAPEATAEVIDEDGWFSTGDIASIDAHGFLSISDRTKDMVKSGGEWISSIDLENAAMAHPGVKNCAVIAVAHPKWGERPLLIVVPEGEPPQKDAVLSTLSASFAKWQLPDDVVFVESLPLTATGKISKRTLRDSFADYRLPGVDGT